MEGNAFLYPRQVQLRLQHKLTSHPTLSQPQPVLQEVGEVWGKLQRPIPHPNSSH